MPGEVVHKGHNGTAALDEAAPEIHIFDIGELIVRNIQQPGQFHPVGAMVGNDFTQDYDFPIITDYQIFDDLRHNRGMVVVLGR